MSKRIIVLLIAFTFLFASAVSAAPAAESGETFYEEIYHLKNIGILQGDENGDIEPEAEMMRAEFATVITRLLGVYNEIGEIENLYFEDISVNHWGKNYILYCTQMGYLVGFGDGTFHPENSVETIQAVKVLVELLGYRYSAVINGGYPTGYLMTAKELGLLKGVDLEEQNITIKNLAKLCFNALTVDLMQTNSYGDSYVSIETVRGENILKKYLKMGTDEAVLNGFYGVHIIGSYSLDEDQILLGDEVFRQPYDVHSFLGKKVRYFYTEDERDIKSIYPTEKDNKETAFSTDKVLSADYETIVIENDTGREQKINIRPTAKIVYNWEFQMEYDFQKLKDMKTGLVKLLDNNGDSVYDVVLIFDYQTCSAEQVSSNAIRDRFSGAVIRLDEEDRILFIRNADGNEVSIKKLVPNMILSVIESERVLDILVSSETAHGTLDSLSDEEAVIQGTAYPVSKALHTESQVAIGKEADAYLDAFGEIVYLTSSGKTSFLTGYLIGLMAPESDFETGKIKLYTENGEMKIYPLPEKVKVSGEKYEMASAAAYQRFYDLFCVEGVFEPQVVKYRCDEAENIAEIVVAADYLAQDEDGFVLNLGAVESSFAGTAERMAAKKSILESGLSASNMNADYNVFCDGKIRYNNKTKFFFVPPALEDRFSGDEKNFAVLKADQMTKAANPFAAYYQSKNDAYADVIVFYAAQDSLYKITAQLDNARLSVFQRIYEGIDEHGETRKGMEYFDGTAVKKAVISEQITSEVRDIIGKLNQGDTIQVILNAKGELYECRQIYTADRPRSESVLYAGASTSLSYQRGFVSAYYEDGSFRLDTGGSETYLYEKTSDLLQGTVVPSPTAVIVVTRTGGRISVRAGKANEINVGDFVIVQSRNYRTKTVVVYRDE